LRANTLLIPGSQQLIFFSNPMKKIKKPLQKKKTEERVAPLIPLVASQPRTEPWQDRSGREIFLFGNTPPNPTPTPDDPEDLIRGDTTKRGFCGEARCEGQDKRLAILSGHVMKA